MLRDLPAFFAELGSDPAANAIGAGVFGMLVALFTLMVRGILDTGKRADRRADAELERARADLETMTGERDRWQRSYIDLLEKRADQ